jgi:hypothetical protein
MLLRWWDIWSSQEIRVPSFHLPFSTYLSLVIFCMRVNFGSGVHLPFIHIRRITFNIINFVILLEIGFLNIEDFLGFFFPPFRWEHKGWPDRQTTFCQAIGTPKSSSVAQRQYQKANPSTCFEDGHPSLTSGLCECEQNKPIDYKWVVK